MNDELYNEIYDAAVVLFRDYQLEPKKGFDITNKDRFEYWVGLVAYGRGFDIGYRDGYLDGVTDMTKEGREI